MTILDQNRQNRFNKDQNLIKINKNKLKKKNRARQSFTKEEWLSTKKLFSHKLKNFDAVILSDYGKGTLLDIPFLIKESKKRKIPVFIDPKGNNFNKYKFI